MWHALRMRILDLWRIIRQRIDFLDLAMWLILRVASRRGGPEWERVAKWIRRNPKDTREALEHVRGELQDRCKDKSLRAAIRDGLKG